MTGRVTIDSETKDRAEDRKPQKIFTESGNGPFKSRRGKSKKTNVSIAEKGMIQVNSSLSHK